jgi:hypothetical protein
MSTEKKDQYEQYLEEPVNTPTPNEEGNEDSDGIIIPYWRGVESKWPELARFAYDALFYSGYIDGVRALLSFEQEDD